MKNYGHKMILNARSRAAFPRVLMFWGGKTKVSCLTKA